MAEATRKTVLVKNATASLHSLTVPQDSLPGEERKKTLVHQAHKLLPGVNIVDAELWEAAKKQKMTELHIKEGHLVELGSKELQAQPEKTAVKLVKETVDTAALETWASKDKRSSVKKAIKEQLEKVGPTKPKDSDEDDDEADE